MAPWKMVSSTNRPLSTSMIVGGSVYQDLRFTCRAAGIVKGVDEPTSSRSIPTEAGWKGSIGLLRGESVLSSVPKTCTSTITIITGTTTTTTTTTASSTRSSRVVKAKEFFFLSRYVAKPRFLRRQRSRPQRWRRRRRRTDCERSKASKARETTVTAVTAGADW